MPNPHPGTPASRRGQWGLEVAGLAFVYTLGGLAVQFLAIPPGYATAFWPSAGIAFGILLVRGCRLWPGVLLGSLAINLLISAKNVGFSSQLAAMVPMATGIGLGAVLQAWAGVVLVRRLVGYPTALFRTGETLAFLGLAGPLASLVARLRPGSLPHR